MLYFDNLRNSFVKSTKEKFSTLKKSLIDLTFYKRSSNWFLKRLFFKINLLLYLSILTDLGVRKRFLIFILFVYRNKKLFSFLLQFHSFFEKKKNKKENGKSLAINLLQKVF